MIATEAFFTVAGLEPSQSINKRYAGKKGCRTFNQETAFWVDGSFPEFAARVKRPERSRSKLYARKRRAYACEPCLRTLHPTPQFDSAAGESGSHISGVQARSFLQLFGIVLDHMATAGWHICG